jgi:hypothetical protein
MKIILTLEDAKTLLTQHPKLALFGLGTLDVTIEDMTPKAPASMNYIEGICRVRHEFPNWHTSGVNNSKIPAIKRLRELTGIGLCEAKYAVERPDEAIDIWIRYGKYLTH